MPCPASGTDQHPRGNRLGLPGWGAALWRRGRGTAGWAGASRALAAAKAESALGCIHWSAARRWREAVILLCSASAWPYLGHWVQFWGPLWPRYTKVVSRLQGVQQRGPEAAEAGALLLWEEAEGVGLVQPGEGMASGDLLPPVPTEVIESRESGSLLGWIVAEWEKVIINQNEVIFPGYNESNFTMRIIKQESRGRPGGARPWATWLCQYRPLAGCDVFSSSTLLLVLPPQLLQLRINSFGGDVADETC